ncbi:hypothetical protein I8D64_05895 [Brachybacterium sp. MASK1Z-5]|uniref:Uncharacterized protein n=1 Tax=Brachybacterium halotolerans TaxID=2795215 RepID=A0ABS1B8F3_9MICO|nr:hypothetical protein [Brachybacterium halotolerans]MBK0330933.1 hypothetical protein [Brachybacterium halotolerans]
MSELSAPHIIAIVIIVALVLAFVIRLAIWIIRRGVSEGHRDAARRGHHDPE